MCITKYEVIMKYLQIVLSAADYYYFLNWDVLYNAVLLCIIVYLFSFLMFLVIG